MRLWRLLLPFTAGTLAVSAFGAMPSDATKTASFLHEFNGVTKVASTVPANGDVNPYGVANVATSEGLLVAGDTLVSNFNSKANVQGTGTTIVEVSPTGSTEPFARVSRLGHGQSCPGGIGLSTALVVLPGGWVVVGSMPTHGGNLPAGDPVGCLIVLNSEGHPVETFTNRSRPSPTGTSSARGT
jgi:hypothetical protein